MALARPAPCPSTLVFIHIPKTAGTTLHKILSHLYTPVLIRHDAEGPLDDEFLTTITTEKPRLVMGHLSVGLHEKLPGVRYITCLRDPVARLLSHYQHALADPTHYLHETVLSRNLSLEEYALSGLSGELDNGMTRMLAGVPDFHRSPVTEETLQRAKANLIDHFDAVILSESFDSGLLLAAADLGWKTPYYIRRKVGHYRPGHQPPSPETLHVIGDHNRFDRELHRWATERFESRAAAVSGHTQQLTRFRQANRHLGKAIFCYRELRRRLSR